MKSNREQIGVVGVDSGQLIVCDPSYIDSQWIPGTEPERSHEGWKDKHTGKVWQYTYDGKPTIPGAKPFPGSYITPIDELGGKTPNELIESEEWTRVEKPPVKETGEFSYRGVCALTLDAKMAGQVNYRLGHEGCAVAFSSGYGDGVYPVYAHRNKEGRIIRVTIEMG